MGAFLFAKRYDSFMQFIIVSICLLALFFILATILVLFFWSWSLAMTRAPFIPMPNEVLTAIIDALELKEGSYLVDLGCGDARVIEAGWKKEPRARFLGIDHAIFPIILARWRLLRLGNSKGVTLRRQNIFKTDVRDVTHVFLYLFPGLMDSILPKLEKELKTGTRLVSCDYPFSKRSADFVIDLHRTKNQLGRKLYIYIF
ncbi:MAG: hypothetical protein WC730_03480 [Patescibacteria group bacterium]|jgi:hypothetical protein